ncbi:DNA-directed RNA polymerase III subunit RPC9, partial [Acrasis kona]
MEVLEENLGPLCFFEVDRLNKRSFNERKKALEIRKRANQRLPKHKQFYLDFPQEVLYVEDQLHEYLRDNTKVKRQTREHVVNFIKDIRKYSLTHAEEMNVLDLAPTQLVELHVIISNCSDRFSEEETMDMIELVNKHLMNEPVERAPKPSFNNKNKGWGKRGGNRRTSDRGGNKEQREDIQMSTANDMDIAMQAA